MNAPFVRRTWIEIDLDTLIHNYMEAKRMTRPGVRFACVVKSNAYGHGLARVSQALEEAGADLFAVSCAREALCLRRAGIRADILVMGLCDEALGEDAVRAGLLLTVASLAEGERLGRAAVSLGLEARLHVKLDTGFHRLGFDCTGAAADEIARLAQLPGIRLEGLYSHLALIDEARDAFQHDNLVRMADALRARGVAIPLLHLCDSIGMLRYPQWQYGMVRAGALLFGVRPARTEHLPFACDPALTFKTTIAQIHRVAPGEPVGYDDRANLTRPSRIATLCAGYGDGYPRCMGGVASVCVRGRLAPVVGLVCMDQMMIDVTDIPQARPGDEVTLLGGAISFAQYADWAHTNRNEAVSILSKRPPRVYYRGGEIAFVDDELL